MRVNDVKAQTITVTERLLLGILGPPVTTTRISTHDRLVRTDRDWDCTCRALVNAQDGDVALWTPCGRHELMFLGKSTVVEAAGPFERVWSVLGDSRVQTWGVPAVGLCIAAVAKIVIDANSLVKRAEEAEGAALLDPLTGLYNRRGWERRIEEERKRLKRDSKPSVAVYMLDVDGLKATNDERGHAAGDAILRHVAKVMSEVTREHDVTARLGGDEFSILTVQSQAAEADLIRARLERGFHSAGLAVSIGFAFANSVDTIGEAMDRADNLMYEVKKNNTSKVARSR